MEALFQFLQTFIELLIPMKFVRSYERGVRWFLGRNPIELAAGPHWRLPFFHQVETVDVADTYIELATQSVVTKDRKLLCFCVSIGYRIDDAVKHFCNVSDFTEAVETIAKMHLAARVSEKTYDEFIDDRRAMETSLKGTLTTRVRDWGVKIIDVGFIDVAYVPRQYRIFGERVTL